MEEIKEKKTNGIEDVFDEKSITGDEDSGYGGKKRKRRRKIVLNLKCPLCESSVKFVGYKDVYQLKKFVSVRGKIISTEKTGICRKHQRQLTSAVKKARFMALLPYVAAE